MSATAPLPRLARRPARRHGAWMAIGLIVAAVLVGEGGFNVVGVLSHEPVQYHHTWSGVVTSVDLAVDNSSVTVVGSNRPGAVVEANGSRGLSTPSDHETLTNGHLRITSSCPHVLTNTWWCVLSYRLTVPAGVSLTVSTGDGSVDLSGLVGPMVLSSGDGHVRVDGPSGSVSAHSGDGNVDVTAARSQRVTASSGDGHVTLGFATAPDQVDASSGDGSVLIELPRGPASYDVDVNSGDGRATDSVKSDSASTRHVNASSGDGNVTVRYQTG